MLKPNVWQKLDWVIFNALRIVPTSTSAGIGTGTPMDTVVLLAKVIHWTLLARGDFY
jgi:hypothetical protein